MGKPVSSRVVQFPSQRINFTTTTTTTNTKQMAQPMKTASVVQMQPVRSNPPPQSPPPFQSLTTHTNR